MSKQKRSFITPLLLQYMVVGITLFTGLPAHALTETGFVRQLNGIQEYRLANGLKIILVENHTAPVVSVNMMYRVGSRHEGSGYTGATHFLEHLLFKDTPSFNRAQQTDIKTMLRSHGANFNASTSLDGTQYYETLPSNQLDLALKIEAERMNQVQITDADRQVEMTVVRNEWEWRESKPEFVLQKALISQAFQAHPYRIPTIGWYTDIEGMSTERLSAFYKDFYTPNNAVLVVVGDIHPPQVLQKITQYFGSIAPAPQSLPETYTKEPAQEGERRFTLHRAGSKGLVNMAYHVPPHAHADTAALEVFNVLLSEGTNSRLHKALVKTGIAVEFGSTKLPLRDQGLLFIHSQLNADVAHTRAEAAITEAIDSFKSNPPSEKELLQARQFLIHRFAFHNDSTHALAMTLSDFEAHSDWRYYIGYAERLSAVSAKDIQRVVNTYLQKHNRTVGYLVPNTLETVSVGEANLSYPEGNTLATPQRTPQALISHAVDNSWRKKRPQGGEIVVVENPLSPTVSIKVSIPAGSLYDPPGKSGLSLLTAAMLKRGTLKDKQESFTQKLAILGSELDTSSEFERMVISGRALPQQLMPTLTLMFDMLQNPRFDEAAFSVLKQRVLGYFKNKLSDPDTLARDTLYTRLYPAGHPYHLSTAKTFEDMQTITLAEVKAFYKKHYGQDKIVVSVVGDIQAAKTGAQLEAKIKALPVSERAIRVPIPTVPAQTQGESVRIFVPEQSNVSIAMGLPTPINAFSHDFFAAQLANHIFGGASGSRLHTHMRETLGLSYVINASLSGPVHGPSPWIITLGTHPKNEQRAIAETKALLEKYRLEGVTSLELERAKSSLIGASWLSAGSNDQLALVNMDHAFFGLGNDYLSKYAEGIQGVSVDDVNETIRKYFNAEQLTTVAVGTFDEVH